MKKSVVIILILGFVVLGGLGFYILSLKNTPKANNTITPSVSSKTYTLAEVAVHKDASSCWTAINGKVYDVTNWIDQHPGGADKILSVCGINGTEAFNGQHSGQGEPASYLSSYEIGTLSQ